MGRDRSERRWLLVTACYAALVAYVVVRDLGATPFDDSYFFKRFALNALEHGAFSWNHEDGPVHGSTSQLFQLVATVVTAMTNTHFIAAIRVLNGVFLVGACALVLRWSTYPGAGARWRAAVVLLAFASPPVLTTVLTGMETALALLVVAVTLTCCVPPPGRDDTPPRNALAAALTVVVYLARPDAAAICATTIVLDRARRTQQPGWYLAMLAGMMLALLAILRAYYGTAFPLSFHMKNLALHSYGETVSAMGLTQKGSHLGVTLAFAVPLVALALRHGTAGFRGPAGALLAGAATFWGYHLLLTNEIMGYWGRFYVPAVVALAMAAATGCPDGPPPRRRAAVLLVAWAAAVTLAYTLDVVPTGSTTKPGQLPWAAYAGFGGALVALLFASDAARLPVIVAALALGLLGWRPPRAPRLHDDRSLIAQHARQVTTFRGVFDVARCLPPRSTVYHSEMGVTGLALLRMRLVDLAGVLSRAPGVDRIPFEQVCKDDRPAAIFLPHRAYESLNREVRRAPCFDDYVRVVEKSSSPLHIRRDLAPAFLRCATEVHRWR